MIYPHGRSLSLENGSLKRCHLGSIIVWHQQELVDLHSFHYFCLRPSHRPFFADGAPQFHQSHIIWVSTGTTFTAPISDNTKYIRSLVGLVQTFSSEYSRQEALRLCNNQATRLRIGELPTVTAV